MKLSHTINRMMLLSFRAVQFSRIEAQNLEEPVRAITAKHATRIKM